MSGTEYEELMDTIRRAAAHFSKYAETEEEVCRLEQAINHDIMYVAAIASERVKSPRRAGTRSAADARAKPVRLREVVRVGHSWRCGVLVDLGRHRFILDELEGRRLAVFVELGHLKQHDLAGRAHGLVFCYKGRRSRSCGRGAR